MNIKDIKGDDAIGAREYKGKIFRILKSSVFFIQEYRKPTLFFWMKPSWKSFDDEYFDSEESAVFFYKEVVDHMNPSIVIPLTPDEKMIKDIVE
jgi:hypothetical protein